MKKAIMMISLLILAFVLGSQNLSAQTSSSQSPWNGPRWSSVNVTSATWDWVDAQGLNPDENGEWVSVKWSYPGKGTWMAYVTWYIDGVYGAQYLLIKSNGDVTEL